MSEKDVASAWARTTSVVARVGSDAQNCNRFVTSICTVSLVPTRTTAVSVRVASTMIGDLAPTSVKTVCASTTNESDGAPCAGALGTSVSVPRMICDESRMKRGNAMRRMLRADGTPPTASVESTGGGGGSDTKLANAKPSWPGVRATDVPMESTRRYHCHARVLLIAMLARESAETRTPYATVPESVPTYRAAAVSNFRLTARTWLTVSTTALSPLMLSLRPGRANSVSRFTRLTSESVNGPARSAKVVAESMVMGGR